MTVLFNYDFQMIIVYRIDLRKLHPNQSRLNRLSNTLNWPRLAGVAQDRNAPVLMGRERDRLNSKIRAWRFRPMTHAGPVGGLLFTITCVDLGCMAPDVDQSSLWSTADGGGRFSGRDLAALPWLHVKQCLGLLYE